MNPFTLKDKTILITGASSGIGRSTAIECSKMGANVIITARNESRLKETFDCLQGSNNKMFLMDLEHPDEIEEHISELPALDGVVNNAGICEFLPVEFLSLNKLNKSLTVNSISPVYLISSLMREKKIKKGSSIVFTSSINGTVVAGGGGGVYAMSKSALVGFVKVAAQQFGSRKIRFNAVLPGMINTDLIPNSLTEEQLKQDQKKYPLKRYGDPEEVAYGIIFLLSDASSFITGTNLIIDGGFSIQ